MVDLQDIKRIYFYKEKVDLRKGVGGLSILVSSFYSEEEIKNSLFVFMNSSKTLMKIYHEDDHGIWLYVRVVNCVYFSSINKQELTKLIFSSLINGKKPKQINKKVTRY